MKVTITYDFPGVRLNSPEAEELIERTFDKYDLRRMADETGAHSVTLDDVAGGGVVEGGVYIERMRVLRHAAHALWDHTDSTDPTIGLMREAAESYAGTFHGVNDCAVVGTGTCDLTGERGELIEVDYEEAA